MTNATTARTDLDDVRDHLVDALLDVNAAEGPSDVTDPHSFTRPLGPSATPTA